MTYATSDFEVCDAQLLDVLVGAGVQRVYGVVGTALIH